jgi:hypothetical protein
LILDRHGSGKMIFEDGSQMEGVWKDGILQNKNQEPSNKLKKFIGEKKIINTNFEEKEKLQYPFNLILK